MELEVFNIKGETTGRLQKLNGQVFGIEPHKHSIYLEIKRYLAAQRQGTHKSKERSELSGSTRKLHKQKGTGGSRKGDIKNPLFRGGARVFGPRPRDYFEKQNKKLIKLAKRSILSQKLKENQIKIIEGFSFESPKTKSFIEILTSLNLGDKKSLFILPEENNVLHLSSRNVAYSKVKLADQLNSYDLLGAYFLVFLEGSIEKIEERLL